MFAIPKLLHEIFAALLMFSGMFFFFSWLEMRRVVKKLENQLLRGTGYRPR
jgi:hypothetical protein